MKTILDYPDGIHKRVPHEIYHGRHLGLVSKSAIEQIDRSPAHYRNWVESADDGATRRHSPALAFGGAWHCSVLEPERFATSYIVEPEWGDCRANQATGTTTEQGRENKRKRDEWRSANEGKARVSAEDMSTMLAMTAAVRAHPLASRMLADGEPELTVVWTDPETGLRCKTRTDYYVSKRRMAVDLKSADDASYSAFRRAAANFGYHTSDAFYRAGFGAVGERIEHYVFVVVEKTPPYGVALYSLHTDDIQKGHAHVVDGTMRLAECIRNDDWPAYPVTIQTLALPPWAA